MMKQLRLSLYFSRRKTRKYFDKRLFICSDEDRFGIEKGIQEDGIARVVEEYAGIDVADRRVLKTLRQEICPISADRNIPHQEKVIHYFAFPFEKSGICAVVVVGIEEKKWSVRISFVNPKHKFGVERAENSSGNA